MTERRCPVVVLISGNGSNLQAIMDTSADSAYEVVGVLSNRPDAYGLQRAADAGVPSAIVSHRDHPDRESFEQALMEAIDTWQPRLLVLAGFMRILTASFVTRYQGRILNIHPSLLPAYRGTNTHQRVLDAGETEHGVSVHFVTEELDGGPVICQAAVPVEARDDKDSLARKVAAREHKIYPEAVDWFAQGRLVMRDNAAFLDGERLPEQGVRIPPGPAG
ncbi:MAG: phosphoribosylglycinamide formyltransferase [Pseudohongiellaceae bacterium]